MALTKIKLNTMVTGTLPDANIPDDITIDTAAAAPANALTGNTLASGVTASSLTSVGTLTGLTVQGSNYTTASIQSGTTSHGAILNLGSSDDIDYGSITQFASSAGEGGRMRFIAGTTETMNLRGGLVGIGTSNPSSYDSYYNNLVVYEDGNAGISIIGSTSSETSLGFGDGTSADTYRGAVAYVHTSGSHQDKMFFKTAATNQMVIDSSGKLGVGTISPDSLIHAKVTTNTSETIRIQNDDSLTTVGVSSDGYSFHTYQHSLYWASWDGSTWSTKGRMDSHGNLGVGTTDFNNMSSSSYAGLKVGGATLQDSGGGNGSATFLSNNAYVGGSNNMYHDGGGACSSIGMTQGDIYFYTFDGGGGSADAQWTTTSRLHISETGVSTFSGHVLPATDNTHDFGSSTHGWRNIYTNDLNLSNMKSEGNDVDGTKGSWTIQEGEDDLFLINRTNGKKYKFKLEIV